MDYLVNIVGFIFVLGVMVLIHELGHFLAARSFDVKVEAFAFGFGPRLFGFRRGETDYKVCLLPLGGFVKMAGEHPGEPPTDDRDFMAKPRWQRMIIAVMGPMFNFGLAIVLLTGLFMAHYEKYAFLEEEPEIAFVGKDSPAARAGILPGDVIRAIDGSETPTWESVGLTEVTAVNSTVEVTISRAGNQLHLPVSIEEDRRGGGSAGWHMASAVRVDSTEEGSPAAGAGMLRGDYLLSVNGQKAACVAHVPELVQENGGKAGRFEVLRDGQTQILEVSPVFDKSEEIGDAWRIGMRMDPDYEVIEGRLSFIDATEASLERNATYATLVFRFLQGLVEARMSPKSIEGPVGIARHAGRALRAGWPALISFMALISVNLGILNLLPIPILDGGVITMLLLESFIRRDISIAIKERIVQVGFLFLMLVFVFVMYNDISK